jgi:hypothetical protein
VSDFFANLAARAVEGSATIRPRLATRFEPVASPEPLTEIIVETTAAETATPTPMAPVVEKAPAAMPSPPASETRASDAVALSPQVTGATSVASVALTEPPASRSALLKAPQPDDDKPTTAAVPIGAAPSAVPPPQPPAGHAAHAPEPPAAPHGDRAAARPIIERTQRAAVAATPPFPLALSPSLPREIGTTPAPRVAAVERPELPAAETIVHVSIGRIELRAPPTPPATKRERATPAVTTLAVYLQQRAARTRT